MHNMRTTLRCLLKLWVRWKKNKNKFSQSSSFLEMHLLHRFCDTWHTIYGIFLSPINIKENKIYSIYLTFMLCITSQWIYGDGNMAVIGKGSNGGKPTSETNQTDTETLQIKKWNIPIFRIFTIVCRSLQPSRSGAGTERHRNSFRHFPASDTPSGRPTRDILLFIISCAGCAARSSVSSNDNIACMYWCRMESGSIHCLLKYRCGFYIVYNTRQPKALSFVVHCLDGGRSVSISFVFRWRFCP